MTTFKFSVMSAVSSDPQAREDKGSLADQEKTARRAGLAQGGIETAGPFVLNGYSRTGYINLNDALEDIPPLKQAIDAALNNEYDVLIVDNIERFGNLAPMIYTLFDRLKKQIHSARQATPIHDPTDYNPYNDESSSIMMHVEGILQKYRLNKIRRGWSLGMPKRIENGLNPTRTPFGYQYVNSKTPPTIDPVKSAKLIQARDMLLGGDSYTAIGELLGIHRSRVPTVLANPFYIGMVAFNKTYVQHSTANRAQIKNPRSKWTTGQGKHAPVFTQTEHEEILAELDRREQVVQRRGATHIFSGLLICDVCGKRVRLHGHAGKHTPVVTCREAGAKHVRWDYDDFFAAVASAIAKEMERDQNGEGDSEQADRAEDIRQKIKANKQMRVTIQEGFEARVYNAQEAAAKVRENEKELERLHADLENATVKKAERRAAAALMGTIDVSDVPEWLARGDIKVINRLLSAWLREIRVGETIKLVKR